MYIDRDYIAKYPPLPLPSLPPMQLNLAYNRNGLHFICIKKVEKEEKNIMHLYPVVVFLVDS
jgi:hypothetical protein